MPNEIKSCGYCYADYTDAENHSTICSHHPQFYFPFDMDKDGKYSKGWQCCGSLDPRAPGCTQTPHRNDIEKKYIPGTIRYRYQEIKDKD